MGEFVMADPYGFDCPAAGPLCPCGVRSCDLAAVHASALVGVVPRFRMKSRGARRHRRKR